jgi:hypothetical protein
MTSWPPGLPLYLQALWYDGKRKLEQSAFVDRFTGRVKVLVVCTPYLHRKEGDIANADYWYRRAHAQRPSVKFTAGMAGYYYRIAS